MAPRIVFEPLQETKAATVLIAAGVSQVLCNPFLLAIYLF